MVALSLSKYITDLAQWNETLFQNLRLTVLIKMIGNEDSNNI